MNWIVFGSVIGLFTVLALWTFALATVPDWIDKRWGYPKGGWFMAIATVLLMAVLLGLAIPEFA